MPYIGLLVTSAGFLMPMLVANRLQRHEERDLVAALAASSLLYHGTVHPLAKVLDMGVAHLVGLRFLWKGTKNMLWGTTFQDVAGMMFSGLSLWMYYARSHMIQDEYVSRRWHMGVHITGQAALLCFVQRQDNLKSHPITIDPDPDEEW